MKLGSDFTASISYHATVNSRIPFQCQPIWIELLYRKLFEISNNNSPKWVNGKAWKYTEILTQKGKLKIASLWIPEPHCYSLFFQTYMWKNDLNWQTDLQFFGPSCVTHTGHILICGKKPETRVNFYSLVLWQIWAQLESNVVWN